MSDDEDDGVLTAALALINDVYSFHQRQDEAVRDGSLVSKHRPLTAAAARLQARVVNLEDTLEEAQNVWRDREMVRVWADVAMSQREQRARALELNAALKATVQDQLSGARRIALLVQTSLQLMQTAHVWIPNQVRLRQDPNHGYYDDLLRHRLDNTDFANDPMWECPRPPLGPPVWERTSHCNGRNLRICNRYGAYLPFKLSTIVRVLWQFVNARGGEDSVELERDEVWRTIRYVVNEAVGFYDAFGRDLCVREYQSDGSVVFKWGTILGTNSGEIYSRENLLAGLVMHETGYIRVTRLNVSGRQPLVYLEDVEWKVIEPTEGYTVDVQGKLARFEAFCQWISQRYNLAGWQRRENALMDASGTSFP